MRSRYIKLDPVHLMSALAGLQLEHVGLYVSILMACYTPFNDYGRQRRDPIRQDDTTFLRRFGDVRKTRRLCAELVEAGLLEAQEDGSLLPVHYDPGAWLRRASTAAEYIIVAKRDGEICRRCGATDGLEVDHIIPVVAEGPDLVSNYQLLCRSCNSRKGGRING